MKWQQRSMGLFVATTILALACRSTNSNPIDEAYISPTPLLGLALTPASTGSFDRLATIEAGRFFRVAVSPECAAAVADFPILVPSGEDFQLEVIRSSLEGLPDASALTYSTFLEVESSGHELKVMQGHDTRVDVPSGVPLQMVAGRPVQIWLAGDTWFAHVETPDGRSLSVRTTDANEGELMALIERLGPVEPRSREDCAL